MAGIDEVLSRLDPAELLQRPARWASVLRWSVLAGLELGIIGPLGSFHANLFNRMAFWTGLFAIGGMTLWPCVIGAVIVGSRRGLPAVFTAAVASMAASLPLAVASYYACRFLWPLHASGMRPLECYGLTLVVVLPAVAGLLWLELAKPVPASTAERSPETRCIERDATQVEDVVPLPAYLVPATICLQMEDHHIRIHTAERTHLHFGSMTRAVALLGEERGMRVHRSWWVAREAVRAWRREGRSVTLTLGTGIRVPVARHRIALLRERGWLDPSSQAFETT